MNEIRWRNRARKQIKNISGYYQDAILEAVDRLAAFPECHGLNITQLKNHQYGFRMRVGRYRVLFDHKKTIQIISIHEVLKRDERTY